jgi:HEAT repeat protein
MAKLDETHPDPLVKDLAFRHLQGIGAPAEKHLLKALQSPDEARCSAALAGLRSSKSDEVLAAVGRAFLERPEIGTINLAFEHLRGTEGKGIPHFLAALKSPQEHARSRAIEGLRFGPAPAEALAVVAEVFRNDASASVRNQASEFLRALGPKADAELLASLASPNADVRLKAVGGLRETKAPAALAEISRIFREDKDEKLHAEAFEYLRRVGAPAEKELLLATNDADKDIKVKAVLALGDARSEASIPRLVELLSDLEPAIKTAAGDALVRIGPKALAAVDAAVEAGRLKKAAADQIRAVADQEEVERILDGLVTEEGGRGHYDGMFKDLAAFGTGRSVPCLLKIASDPKHRYRFAGRRERIGTYPEIVRELAIMALGELKDPAATRALKGVLARESEAPGRSSIRDELIVSLHRLGEKKPLEDYLATAQKRIDEDLKEGRREQAFESIFSLGIILNRTGRREEAESAYGRLAKLVEEKPGVPGETEWLPHTWYNLACLAALRKDVPVAVERLRRAVKAGFRDREWIRLDRDLDALRDDAGYRALLADDALFEKPVR